MPKKLNNRQTAELKANLLRIAEKLETDEIVENAFNPNRPKTYREKIDEVDRYLAEINNDPILESQVAEAFDDRSTYKQKADAVERLRSGFRKERKEKEKVDRKAENARDKPNFYKPPTYSQKVAAYNDIQNFYKREKKQEADAAERLLAATREKNVFNFVKTISPNNDIYSYRRALNQYAGLSTTRSYVENPQRMIYNRPVVGGYVSFRYWAKNWQTLPKFDRSPLVYVTSVDGDRFTGINFHWCVSNNIAFDLIDEIESGNTNIPFPDECWHTYLLDPKYMRSPFYNINSDEIRVAVMLPLSQWFIK